MLAQLQPIAREAKTLVPRQTPIAPILVPLSRRAWMAEKLDLHLLELARAKREISRCDLITKALAHLRDAKRNTDARAIEHVLEIHKDALRRLRPQKCRVLLRTHRPDDGLEHQVEFA